MGDFKGRKKVEVPCPKHGDFLGGSGHGPESLCQISAYYKFFPGKSYFYRTIHADCHSGMVRHCGSRHVSLPCHCDSMEKHATVIVGV